MPYITCTFCKRSVMQQLNIKVCAHCLRTGNDTVKFYAIKEYLEENPEANIKEIKDALKIDEEIINKFIKEGSLQLIPQVDIEKNNDRIQKIKNFRNQVANLNNYNNKSNKEIEKRPHNGRSQLIKDLEERKDRYDPFR